MVTPAAEREAVAHLKVTFEMSERRACQTVGCCRMTVRYASTRGDDGVLRDRMKAIAIPAAITWIDSCDRSVAPAQQLQVLG